MALPTRLRVDDLPDDKAIYVRNRSNGDFLLTIHSSNSGPQLVPIPKTFIPIEVTAFCEPSLFKKSSDFRRSLNKGVIELISEEAALKILDTPNGRAELERIRRETTGVAFIPETNHSPSPLEVISENNKGEAADLIKDIIIREDLDESEKLRQLTVEQEMGNLTKDDLEYITLHTDSKSRIHKWALKIIEQKNENLFTGGQDGKQQKGSDSW